MIVRYTTKTHTSGQIPVEIKKRLTMQENSDKVKIIERKITLKCLNNFVES